ncbi:MAG: hypothetical protein LBC61_06050 [Candidatus Peribacteria bacterium]|jgi:hypothetical protein|nr:hypothetical protein [Candidatus Peribacteria bacterium]
MLLVTIALIIAYVVFNNTFIISNTLIFDENAKELNQALEKKADVNLKATIEYYLNGDRDDDNY